MTASSHTFTVYCLHFNLTFCSGLLTTLLCETQIKKNEVPIMLCMDGNVQLTCLEPIIRKDLHISLFMDRL